MEIRQHMMVTDRSQRTGYTSVYRVVKIENDRALVQFVGEHVNGRFANMSNRRDESYRDITNLREFR